MIGATIGVSKEGRMVSRRVLMNWVWAGIPLLAFLLCTTRPAYAYVDPGAGILTLQIIGSAFAGMIFMARRRLRSLLATVVQLFHHSTSKH